MFWNENALIDFTTYTISETKMQICAKLEEIATYKNNYEPGGGARL